jgi:DNA repair protein RadC
LERSGKKIINQLNHTKMKKLLLITVLLVVATTKSVAQVKNAIEIKNLEQEFSKKERNEFKIVAHEEVDVNLKFQLKKEEAFNVLILDRQNRIVFSREYYTEGENKIAFTMDQDEQYTVKLSNPKQLTNVIVTTVEN